jgi:hypothetical protein
MDKCYQKICKKKYAPPVPCKTTKDRIMKHFQKTDSVLGWGYKKLCFRKHRQYGDLPIGWMIQNLIPGRHEVLTSSPRHPNQLWRPPSSLFNG